jgi:hypothetical protein
LRRCRVALPHTLKSTAAFFNPPSPPTCSQFDRAGGKRTDGAFGLAIVDREPHVVEVPNERSPLIAGILDGLPEQALWRRGAALHFDPVTEAGEDRLRPRSP